MTELGRTDDRQSLATGSSGAGSGRSAPVAEARIVELTELLTTVARGQDYMALQLTRSTPNMGPTTPALGVLGVQFVDRRSDPLRDHRAGFPQLHRLGMSLITRL